MRIQSEAKATCPLASSPGDDPCRRHGNKQQPCVCPSCYRTKQVPLSEGLAELPGIETGQLICLDGKAP